MPAPLVLASSSVHRRALLDRLHIDYETCSPDIDESRRPRESPHDYVSRLSCEKARAVAARFPDSLIIGSDQAAVRAGQVLGKPGTHRRALAQLLQASGGHVDFHSGVALLNSGNGQLQVDVIRTRVHFRALSEQTLDRYLRREQPYDCAGSFRSEGLGISLFERIETDDPTALIGLPLIRLVTMLAAQGLMIP
jgi:MAF protein